MCSSHPGQAAVRGGAGLAGCVSQEARVGGRAPGASRRRPRGPCAARRKPRAPCGWSVARTQANGARRVGCRSASRRANFAPRSVGGVAPESVGSGVAEPAAGAFVKWAVL